MPASFACAAAAVTAASISIVTAPLLLLLLKLLPQVPPPVVLLIIIVLGNFLPALVVRGNAAVPVPCAALHGSLRLPRPWQHC